MKFLETEYFENYKIFENETFLVIKFLAKILKIMKFLTIECFENYEVFKNRIFSK